MAYEKNEAVCLVIEAGHRLVAEGLIARTWGNISARISDTQFVITPSGRAYETLTPADIVTVNITDGSYQGDVKPSSEKGVHAVCYAQRKDVNFVIHTHQLMATAVGVTGQTMNTSDDVLGGAVPCARYGLPGRKGLREAVQEALGRYPAAKAAFMRCHGTVCLGGDCEEAFAVARRLEEVCRERVEQRVTLTMAGGESHFEIPDTLRGLVKEPYLLLADTPAIREVSRQTGTIRPVIDDMAQIGGVDYRCIATEGDWATKAARHLRGRNVVLLQGVGAICTGVTMDEAQAVATVLEKNCLAMLYGRSGAQRTELGYFDALLQRMVYVKKYAKLKQ